jgi:hypothetical protein
MKNKNMYDSAVSFATYLKKSTEKSQFVKSFEKRFHTIENLKINSIFDVGCHDGDLTLWYLDKIKNKLTDSCVVTCLDPSNEALIRFSQKQLINNIDFNFVTSKVENFIFKSKYDLIVASHSLYWTDDLNSILKQISDNSKFAVVVLREEVGIYEIQSRFKELIGNKDEKLYTANNIESVLKDLNINFIQERIRAEIELPDKDSKAYQDLVAFFLQTTSTAISKDKKHEIDEYLNTKDGTLKHNVSFFWLGNGESFES